MLHRVCIQYSVFRIQYSMSLSIYVLIYMRCSLESRTHIYDREPNLPVVLREGSQLPLTQARCAQSFEREKQRTQAQLGSARLDAIDSRNDFFKKTKNRLKQIKTWLVKEWIWNLPLCHSEPCSPGRDRDRDRDRGRDRRRKDTQEPFGLVNCAWLVLGKKLWEKQSSLVKFNSQVISNGRSL
jgi:hypothetical protein